MQLDKGLGTHMIIQNPYFLHYDAPMSDSNDAQRAIEMFRTDFARVKSEVLKVIVGQTNVVDGVLIALFAGGHVLLEGVPGLGKTLLIRTLSQALHMLNSTHFQTKIH